MPIPIFRLYDRCYTSSKSDLQNNLFLKYITTNKKELNSEVTEYFKVLQLRRIKAEEMRSGVGKTLY